jgi:hypothetical protein
MKMTNKLSVGLATLMMTASLCAMKEKTLSQESEETSCRNKYKGVEITNENIGKDAPKLSLDKAKVLNDWFGKEGKEVWKTVVQQPGKIEDFEKKEKEIQKLLGEKKIKNLSKHNIVFDFPGSDKYVLKISGTRNRLGLEFANQNLGQSKENIKLFNREILLKVTFQTISRIFHGLKLNEAIEKNKLDEIERYDGVLWGPEEDHWDDESCVVIEKKLDGYKKLCDYDSIKVEKLFTENKLRQLCKVIRSTGLWNITGDNIMVNEENGNLALVDTEQPNSTKPSQAWNKDKDRYKFNVSAALQTLYETLQELEAYKACETLKKIVREDKDLMDKQENNNGCFYKIFDEEKK